MRNATIIHRVMRTRRIRHQSETARDGALYDPGGEKKIPQGNTDICLMPRTQGAARYERASSHNSSLRGLNTKGCIMGIIAGTAFF